MYVLFGFNMSEIQTEEDALYEDVDTILDETADNVAKIIRLSDIDKEDALDVVFSAEVNSLEQRVDKKIE